MCLIEGRRCVEECTVRLPLIATLEVSMEAVIDAAVKRVGAQ